MTVAAQLAFLSCFGLDRTGRGDGDPSHPTEDIVSRRSAISQADLDPTKPFFNSVTPAVLPTGATTLPDAVMGTADVAPDGSATYQFPLEIPDGVEGMKPSLGISYRGRRGVGLLGPGWNLDGMSAIVRCRRSLAQDGFDIVSSLEQGAPKFLRDSTYCLDGVRLVHKVSSIPPNQVGAEFYPEDGTPTKVVVDTTDQTGSNTTLLDQAASFRVYFPDGRIGYYGTTSASRIEYSNSPGSFLRYAFHVEKIADRFGNSIDFTYTRAAPTTPSDPSRVVEPMPDRITYTSYGTTAGPHQIAFNHQNASKPRLRYIETLAIETTTVLKSIAVNSDYASFDATGTAVPGAIRFYNFTYNTSSGTGFSVLNQIQCCTAKKNGSGTWVSDVCTSPTTVGWTANSTSSYQRIALDTITDIVPAGAQNYGRITIADVDNDGRDDLVYKVGVDSKCAKWVYRLSTGLGFGNAVDMNLSQTCSPSSQVGAKFQSDIFPVNLNSRGAVDFITPVMVSADGFTSYTGAFTNNDSGTPVLSPFNLDGLASATQGFTLSDPGLGIGETEPMVTSVIRPSIAAGQTTGVWNEYKLSPNGLGGVSVFFSHSVGTYFKNWPPIFVDLNGDGMDELVSPDSTAYLFTPDPVNFGTNLPVLRSGDQVTGRSWFMDVNGDGHKDVAYISAADANPGSILRVRLNKGDYTFGPDIASTLVLGWNVGVSGISSGLDIGVRVADVNLDGLDDILLVDNGAALIAGNLSNGSFVSRRASIRALISGGDGTFTTSSSSQPTYNSSSGSVALPLGDVATGYDGVPAPLQGYRLTQTLDANGDGLTDIVQTEGGKLRLYLRTGSAPELVTTITEGGARTITYQLTSTFGLPTVRCRELNWPRICGGRGLWVVSALSISGPVPHNLSYEYQDPSIDRAGRGFLGFATRRIRDQERASLTQIEYSDLRLLDEQTGIQPAKYFYLSFNRVTQYVPQVSGKLMIITDTRDVPAATVVDGRLIVQHVGGSTTVADCTQIPFSFTCAESTPRTLSSRNYDLQYDSYGHVTSSDVATTIPGKGDEHRQKQVIYSDPDLDNWLINIPNTSYDISLPVGARFGRALMTEYDTDGIRMRSRTTPGNDGEEYKQERFHYDDRGRLYETVAVDSLDQDEFTARRAFTSFGPGGIYPTGLTMTTSTNVTQTVALTWRHPAYGYLVQQVDANNVVQKQTFDTSGLPLSKSDSRSSPTTFTYGLLSSGTRWQITSTFGSEKQIDDLDELGRVVNHAWTDSTGATVGEARGYDVFGNLSSVRSNFSDGNYETSYGFDNLDRPTSRCLKASRTLAAGTPVAPTFECSQYTYDGNKTTVVAPDGVTTELTNDEVGRLSTRVRSGTNPGTTTLLTETTQFDYGYFDLPNSVTTPSGTVSFTYDNLFRLQTMSRGTSGTSYGYNSFGEVLTETHAKDPSVVGQSPEVDRFVSRDLAGRPVFDNGGTYTWDTAANGKWQLASTHSFDGVSTTHAYDANGLPAIDTWGIGTESFAIDRTYDTKGRLDTLTYPQAGTFGRLKVKYAYNQFTGLVDSLTDLGTNKILWQAVTRNSAGVIRSETMNGGQVKRNIQLYEGSLVPYNVTFQNGTTPVLSEALLYYPGGNLMARRSTLGASVRTEQLVFDGLDRVWTWTPNDGSDSNLVTYGYAAGDEIGSRSVSNETVWYSKTNVDGSSSTDFISRLSLTNSRTGAVDAYDSDALGRTTKTPAGTFTYSPYDLPKTFVPTSGSSVNYLYDTGRAGVVKNSSNGDQEIALSGLFRRVKTGSAFSYQHALIIEGRVVGTIEHQSSGGAYANVEFYHRDQVGSVRAIATNAMTVARNGTIDPYGNQMLGATPFLPGDAASVAGSSFHGFQSLRHDLRAGLIDMNGRYYSPRTGRFMSDDPVIADPMNGQSYSAKAFVFGNPSAFTDPTGFCNEPEGNNPCPDSGGGFGDWKGWENAARTVGGGIRTGVNGTGHGIAVAYRATTAALDDAYHATIGWFKDQYNSINPTRGPAVPGAPTTPISDQNNPTTISGGTNQHSATEMTTGANSATSLGNSFLRGFPGAHYVRLSQDAVQNGRPVLGGVYAVASILDAATVLTGGEGTIAEKLGVRATESLATRGLAGGGRHIALGLERFGLGEVAERVGAETLLRDPAWKATLLREIANPASRFTVSVEGLSGFSVAEKVLSAAQQGIRSGATPTNWELGQLYQAGRLGEVTFVDRLGQVLANPFK